MNAKLIAYRGAVSVTILGGIVGYGFYKLTSPVGTQTPLRSNLEIAIADMCKDDYIASVIAKSKYPLELAAIARVESGCTPWPTNISGVNAYGLYQVRPSIWGDFSGSVEGQTKKAEQVFESLLYQYGYNLAIERYNGKGMAARIYKKKVLKIRKELLDKVAKMNDNPIKR